MGFNPNGKLAMYANAVMEWVAGGGMDHSTRLSDVSIKTQYDRVTTKNAVTMTWCVAAIPTEYNLPVAKRLRDYLFTKFRDVDVMITTSSSPITRGLNINTEQFKAQMAAAEDLYTKRLEFLESGSRTERVAGKSVKGWGIRFSITPKDVKASKDKFMTYDYLYDSITNGGEAFQTHFFLTASFKKNDRKLVKLFERTLNDYFSRKGNEFSYFLVEGNVKQCLSSFGPFGAPNNEGKTAFPSLLMTDENLSVCGPYVERGLHNPRGYYLGLDVNSMLPFRLDLTGSGSSQVILCVGQSGCGKTYTCGDGFVFGALAHNHHVSVFDIKGEEYSNLTPFADSIILDLSAKSGKYVNTLRLDDFPIHGSMLEAKELYLSAINSTIGWLSAIVNLKESEGNVRDLEGFLRKTLEYFYAKYGVLADNPLTYKNSKDMDIHDIPRFMLEVAEQAPPNTKHRTIGTLAHERCSVYLSTTSPSGNIFREEVTLADVVKKNLVIYAFGLNAGVYLGSTEGIKSHMANAIDTKKEYFLKRQGKFLTVLYEELNSCKYVPFFIRNVSSRVVRSRSNNVNVVMLMNSLQVLLEMDFKDIASNIKTMIVGALNQIDIPVLDQFNASDIKSDVEKISQKETTLNNCFAIKYDTGGSRGATMIKAYYPDYVSSLLETRKIDV